MEKGKEFHCEACGRDCLDADGKLSIKMRGAAYPNADGTFNTLQFCDYCYARGLIWAIQQAAKGAT